MTPDRFKPLLDREFLRAELAYEYEDYQAARTDDGLRERLATWAARELTRETQAESAFLQRFFVELWGYRDTGTGDGFELWPKFPIAGAGQSGNKGEADLALGRFGKDADGKPAGVPQVVCEFKDIRSGLDAPQSRKGNNRSPVMQAKDYLWNARRGLFGNEAVQPRYAIVTDMNDFRLYWWDGFPDRYLRFKIQGGDLFNPQTLVGTDEEAQFDRFLFARLFKPDMLLSEAGRTRLERLIEKQGIVEKRLEDTFYADYRAYWTRLQRVKVIDLACGSGAFLIVALSYLEQSFAAAVTAAYEVGAIERRVEDAEITEAILTHNLWGVDINPASVEITRLSLWLHTAKANRPLSSLDRNIACGNSLVDDNFYKWKRLDDPEERDRINTFDWRGDFALASFDAVIGNPPYVKLQNFMKVNADMAGWLASPASAYRSTRTGNFDLYLPFIERGLQLLNDGGRMGYIAPNLWPTLEYGEGLRGLIHAGRHLDKWLDFRSFQVFEEATVYTAIQIFSKGANEAIRLGFAGEGDTSKIDWRDPALALPYAAIDQPLKPWLIAPAAVRELIARLAREATPLSAAQNTDGIIVGIQTSADHIYHLRKVANGRYAYRPREVREAKGKVRAVKLEEVVVEIEDALMKPLVSGADVKRFLEPRTTTHLLFPYHVDEEGARLFTAAEMEQRFPKGWRYLRTFEAELRKRDNRKSDTDEKWFGYIYPKNLGKQEMPKLLVAQLVPDLRVAYDNRGAFYANNVRVNGILPHGENGWFLLGALNAPVTNYVFKWLGKPKDNGFFEANKQFIAPLPIPRADRTGRASLIALAKGLQQRRTEQMDERAGLAELLGATSRSPVPLDRLLPDVRPISEIEANAPKRLPSGERKAWVDGERAGQEEAALARMDAMLRPASALTVAVERGAVRLLIDGTEAARLFVIDEQGALVEAQWRAAALDFAPQGKGDGKRLTDRLRRVAFEAEPAVAAQIVAAGARLAGLDAVLREDEAQLHEVTCGLFGLTPEERALVDAGR